MGNSVVDKLRAKTDAAWRNLSRQLEGLEPHLERSDAPGEWTTREVLSHLLFEPGWDPVAFLRTFSHDDPPPGEIVPGRVDVTAERRRMTLREFVDVLDGQRRGVLAYLDSLPEADLQRKARIPFFKPFMGTDEIPIPVYVRALFDHHWNDHAGQLAKIRKAVGLPDAQ